MQETWVQFLGQEDPLEKEMATHSSILAWRIPWTEPWRATVHQVTRVGHDLVTKPPSSSFSLALFMIPCCRVCVCVCVCVCVSHSVVSNSLQPHGVPLSRGFPRQEYWSGLPCSLPGNLPDPGIEPMSPASLLHCRWILYCWANGGAPSRDLLYSKGNYTKYFVTICKEKLYEKESPNHSAVHLRVTQHWKASLLQ